MAKTKELVDGQQTTDEQTDLITSDEASELDRRAEEKESKRWIDSKKIPRPFRRSHLSVLMDDYAKENGLRREEMKPREFLVEQGLPTPLTRFRVCAFKGGSKDPIGEPEEFDAVDQAEAIRLFKEDGEHNDDPELKKMNARFEVMIVRA